MKLILIYIYIQRNGSKRLENQTNTEVVSILKILLIKNYLSLRLVKILQCVIVIRVVRSKDIAGFWSKLYTVAISIIESFILF